MFLDELVAAQKRGEARGLTSVCSAHPWVLRAAMQASLNPVLIEATCNQVNQYGGYTGMTPAGFVGFVGRILEENGFPFDHIILGGDHLGPSVWQNEPAETAMQKAETLIRDYVQAGFIKIHLDCSMRLGDDPEGALDVEVSAARAGRLARVAEAVGNQKLRYVIGTEVPLPGGATEHEEGVSVTKVADAGQTIEATHAAFLRQGLEAAWERVIALVVQPGLEYGDDFVLPYQAAAAQELSRFIESQPMVYEVHSTDYQTRQVLSSLVQDHFAILKVGPALTFAFRQAVFALALVEDELIPAYKRSNIVSVLDQAMLAHPEHWRKYYRGSEFEQAFKRKYSFSDRIRYYWTEPRVQRALKTLLAGLAQISLPVALLDRYLPEIAAKLKDSGETFRPEQVLLAKIESVLADYQQACNPH